jgi:hypothetical protein
VIGPDFPTRGSGDDALARAPRVMDVR